MEIGKNIRNVRKELKIGQKELADMLHISDKTVSSWEVGRTEPNMEMIEAMATALKIEKTDIINGKISGPVEFSDEEKEIIAEFRKADEDTKRMIKRLLAYGRELKGKV